MVNQKLIKLNGNLVRNIKESIGLFSILELEKSYVLTLNIHGKFTLEENKNQRRKASKSNKQKALK